MATTFTSFTPVEEAETARPAKFTSFTPLAEEPGFFGRLGPALSRGVSELGESAAGISLGLKSAVGANEAAGKQAEEIRKEQATPKKESPAITWESLENTYGKEGAIEALKKLPSYVAEQVLQSAPSMAVPLAAGAAAGAVSGPFAPIVAPLAGMGTYGVQQFGQFMQRQAQEGATGETLAPGKAALTAALTAPIGFYADKLMLGMGKIPEKILGEQIAKELAKRTGATVAGRVATGATIGVIAEAPTEVLEQAGERWQAGLPLMDEQAKKEYKEAFFGAAAVGGLGGGVSRGINKPAAETATPTAEAPVTPVEPVETPETPTQQRIAQATGINEVPTTRPEMLSHEEAAAQRMPLLQAKVEEDMQAQEERMRREGPRPVVPEREVVETSRFDNETPALTSQEELLAKQAEIDQMRLAAGLPTGESSLTPGVQPEVAQPTEVLAPKIVDNRPLEAGAAKNRLLVMRNMLQNEGGDPASLTIVPHPTAEGRFAIQSLDVPARFTPEMQGNKNETGRVRETTVTRTDETGKPYTETTETPSGPGMEIDPIKTYIDIARKTNTPASMRLVRDFDSGLVTREDVQAAIDAEHKAGRPLPLNYTKAGEPWFLAPDIGKPRGNSTLPISATLKPTPEGPEVPPVTKPAAQVHAEVAAGGRKPPPFVPPSIVEEPPETPTGDEPPPPTGTRPTSLEEFKQRMPVSRRNPEYAVANQSGSFKQLADIMAMSKNPAIKRIGELSRGIANKVILHKPGNVGKGYAGVFRYADNSIQMAKAYADDEHTNAHESLHALVARAQRYPNERQAPIAAQIKKLYLYSQKELEKKGKGSFYGLTNEREFTAEAMTNPEFQYELMQIPYPGNRSAWTQFVRLVADLLGIKETNALTEVMNLTDKLARVKQTRTSAEKGATEFDTVEGIKPQERDANFKRWFGKSVVRTKDGKPLVVYHGTDQHDQFADEQGQAISQFDGYLMWFAKNPYTSNNYATSKKRAANIAGEEYTGSPTSYPVHLSIQNPVVLPFDMNAGPKLAIQFAKRIGADVSQFADADYAYQIVSSPEFQEAAIRKGFDGVIANEDGEQTYAVFQPNQIKSATGNKGTFNPESPDIEALEMPSFGKKPAHPTPTNVGKQAMDIVSQTGMAAAPPPLTRAQVAQQVIAKVKEDPALTAKTAKAALTRALDKFETSMFSGDAAFNNEIRRNLMKDFADNPEVLGMLLEASQSQAVHSDALATQFIVDGGIAYDDDTNKWVSVKKEDNFIKLAKNIEALQQKYNLSKEDAERIAHTYFVAKRYQSLAQKQAERNADIARLEAQLKKEQNNSKLTPAQRDSIVKGLRSDIKKLQAAEVYISDDQRAMIKPGMSLGSLMPELEKISDTWQGIRVNAIKAMVDGGLWNMQTAEAMLDNIDYVPFYREDQLEEGKGPQEFIKGLEVKAKEYKLKGSNSPVNDVFDNMVRWTQYAINRSVRNHKAVQMIDLATEINLGDEKMAKKVEEMDKDKNIVRVFRDGVQELYEVADPLYMDAFTAINNVAMPNIKFFSFMADLLRKTVVLNPLFSLAQVPSDAYAAMFSSGLKTPYALSIPARAVKEFVKTLNKTSATHNLLKQYGATGVRDFNATIARQDVEIAAGLKSPKDFKGKVMEGLSHFAMAADNAVRQAVYEASMAQGLSKSEAIEKAFEIINFRRRGTNKTINVLGQTVPFFYAYMSVQRVAMKTLTLTGISPQERGEALKTLAYTSAAVMALSMLYTMANGGDDEYEKTPVAIRDRTLHVPGTVIRIPLRPDFFLFPKIVSEHLYHMITDKGLTDGAKFRKSMAETLANAVLSPQPIPQAIKPIFEAGINYDFFQGKPIVGPFEQKKEATRQFNDNTSELSKILSHVPISYSAQRNQFEGISPIVLDHVIRGMFGSLGGLTMFASNFMLHSDPNVERPSLSFRDALAGIPGTSGFVTRANESRLKNDFFELRDAVERANATYKDIEKRSPEGIADFLKDEKNLMRVGLVKDVESVARELSEIRNAISQISNAPKDVFTAEQKEKSIKDLRSMEQQMMKAVPVAELRKLAKM